jgi:hypothetical protein
MTPSVTSTVPPSIGGDATGTTYAFVIATLPRAVAIGRVEGRKVGPDIDSLMAPSSPRSSEKVAGAVDPGDARSTS